MTLPILLLVSTLVALALSQSRDPERTRKALRMSWRSLMALAPSLLAMTGAVGLVLALAPAQSLARLFGVHGVAGFALVSVVGAIVTLPGPVAYPLAGRLLHLGIGLPALAAFITALTTVGVVTAPMEVTYFGKRFTLLRQSLSFLLAILVAVAMGVLLR